MSDPSPWVFLLMCSAFILLTLVSFSVPFVSSFYFLHADIYGGVKFGIWGWCFDITGLCSPKKFGYYWDPQMIAILTRFHIFFPIAAFITLIAALTLVPVMCSRQLKMYPYPMFSFLSLLSFVTSLVALIFALVTWLIARGRFHKDNIPATLGPLIWMSLAATVLLMGLSITSGCGMMCTGRMGRRASYITYTY